MEMAEFAPSTRKIPSNPGPEFPDIDHQSVRTCLYFMRVAKKATGVMSDHFARAGISPGKYSILMELVSLPPGNTLSPSELADRVGVTRPTVTGLIDGLKRQGFIKRNVDPQDRRKVVLMLTSKGRDFIDGLMPVQFRKMSAIFDGLSKPQQDELCGLLFEIESRTDDMVLEEGRDGDR